MTPVSHYVMSSDFQDRARMQDWKVYQYLHVRFRIVSENWEVNSVDIDTVPT